MYEITAVKGPVLVTSQQVVAGTVLYADSRARFVSFQWYIDGVAIVGATASSYTVTGNEVGPISLEYTFLDSSKMTAPNRFWVNSVAVHPGGIKDVVRKRKPVARKVVAPGDALTAELVHDGTTFQWYKDDTAIPGATTQIYTVQESDRGSAVFWVATRPDGSSDSQREIYFVLNSTGLTFTTDAVYVPGGGVGNTVITVDGISVTLAGSYPYIITSDKKVLVNATSPVVVLSQTPGYSTNAFTGLQVNGSQLNPMFNEDMGYDEHTGDWDPAKRAVYPVTIPVGSVHVVTKGKNYDFSTGVRIGFPEQVLSIFVMNGLPTYSTNVIGPAPISWPSRPAITAAECDVDVDFLAYAAALPTYPITVASPDRPNYTTRYNAFARHNPLMAQKSAAGNSAGYQAAMCHDTWATGSNYGSESDGARVEDEFCMILLSDAYTTLQKADLLLWRFSFAKDIYTTWKAVGKQQGTNGGHFQFGAPMLGDYLKLKGLSKADIWNVWPGNLGACFKITQTMIDTRFVTHDVTSEPWGFRQRDIVSIAGDRLSCVVSAESIPNNTTPAGGNLYLIADGTTHPILGPTGPTDPVSGQFTLTFATALPGGFTVGTNNVRFAPGPDYDASAGVFDRIDSTGGVVWSSDLADYTFFRKTPYRDNQAQNPQTLYLVQIDMLPTDLEPAYWYNFACMDGFNNQNSTTRTVAQTPFWEAVRPTIAALAWAPVNGSTDTATLTPTTVLRDRVVYDSGFQRGLSSASVPLTGTTTAPNGATIQVRAVDVEFGGTYTTAWTTLGTASAGTFFGVFQAPRAPCWYRAEVRVQDSTAPATQLANRFAAGHVWSFWEQSNWDRLISNMPGTPGPLYDAISHEWDVQIITRVGGASTAQLHFVTEANKNTNPVTPAMVSFANAWSALRPGEKLALAFNVRQGTSYTNAMTREPEEGTDGRDWKADRAIHNMAADDAGTQVGVAWIPGWIESHSVVPSIPLEFLKGFTGHDAAGAKINIETIHGGSSLPRAPVKIMADGSTTDLSGTPLDTPDVTIGSGGGIYDMRYTRAGFFGPHGYSIANIIAANTVATHASLPLYSALSNSNDFASIVANAKTLWNSATFPEVLTYPGQNFGSFRDVTDALHIDAGDRDGRQRHCSISVFLMTKALGLHNYDIPVLNGRYDEPAGAYADFWITGRSITTERRRRELAGTLGSIPTAIPPLSTYGAAVSASEDHRTQVMGWAINKAAAKRAEIVTASGHPVLPDGQTFCRVYNNGIAFTSGDEILYGFGVMPGYLVTEDYADRVYLDYLVCDVGQPHAVLPAIPVQMQQSAGIPTTLPTPNRFKVSGTTFIRTQTSATPSGTGVYFESRFRVDAFHASSMELMGIGNDGFVTVNSNGSVSLNVNGGFITTTAAGVLQVGVFKTLGFKISRAVGSPLLEIIDVSGGGTVLATTTTTATGATFNPGRVSFFFRGGSGNAPFNGTFEYSRVWDGQLDGTGTPDNEIVGIAAAPHYELRLDGVAQTATLAVGSSPYEMNNGAFTSVVPVDG